MGDLFEFRFQASMKTSATVLALFIGTVVGQMDCSSVTCGEPQDIYTIDTVDCTCKPALEDWCDPQYEGKFTQASGIPCLPADGESWYQESVIPLEKPMGLVMMILNILSAGLGTCLSACLGEKFSCFALCCGILQGITAAVVVGAIWSIVHGVLLFKKEYEPFVVPPEAA